MIRKGGVRWVAKGDAIGKARFVAKLFGIIASLPDLIKPPLASPRGPRNFRNETRCFPVH